MGEESLWRDVSVKRLWVPELSHPRILDDGKNKLHSLAPRRLVCDVVGGLGLVRRFCACADDSRSIFINCCVIGSDACWFGELCAIERCVSYCWPNEAGQVVGSLCFVVRDLEEERRQDLPDSREVSV